MASLYQRNGSKIWWVRFQLHGLRVQKSSGQTRKSDALRFLAKAMEAERQRQEQGFQKSGWEELARNIAANIYLCCSLEQGLATSDTCRSSRPTLV